MGRYTDIARHDLNLGVSAAHALAPVLPPAARKREPARPKTDPASALAALIGDEGDGEDHPRASPSDKGSEQPAPEHDGLLAGMKGGLVMRGATPHRLVLFTFDDGPDRSTTPILLDRLDAAGVHAVFFLTGANLRGINVAERKNQEIARETVRRGHWVASHGMNHKQLPLLSDVDALQEITLTEKMFESVLGGRPWLVRPPGGARSSRIDRLLAARGYSTMLWNVGAGDFQVRTAADVHATWAAVQARREAQGERGGIVLLHDTYAWSVEAFQLIVNDLLARNCELLERGEELYDFVDDPAMFFTPRGTAHASVEAPPLVLSAEELEKRQAPLREETRQRCSSLALR